jgi:hypothetical protein
MSDNKVGRMGGVWQGGTLPSATPVVVVMNGAPLPCTATLKSADAGRLIEVATDGGTTYYPPTTTLTATGIMVLAITYPVSHVRFTGASAGTDTWSIR